MARRKKESFFLEILDEQDDIVVDTKKITTLCEKILADASVRTGRLGVVLVDPETIRQYNRDFLQHDYPTDVISFPIEERLSDGHLEAEVLACTQVAKERAGEFAWTPEEEILLYIVHGVLHLVGFDDATPDTRSEMRKKEKEYLAYLEIDVPDFDADPDAVPFCEEQTNQKDDSPEVGLN